MAYYDNMILMALGLDRWSPHYLEPAEPARQWIERPDGAASPAPAEQPVGPEKP